MFGLGCTASLTTNRVKRGQTRAYWAIHKHSSTHSYTLTLDTNLTRDQQEQLLVDAIWVTLSECLLGIESTDTLRDVNGKHASADEQMLPLFGIEPYKFCATAEHAQLLLPGSFNPLHQGHIELLEIAQQITSKPGAYELTVKNADKPALDYLTLNERLTQFTQPVWLTNTPNFVDKAKLFPDCTFALGIDTMVRIAQSHFYPNGEAGLQQAIEDFNALNTSFLVFGRLQGEKFLSLEDISLPNDLLSLCEGVGEDTYRSDLSSTELRR